METNGTSLPWRLDVITQSVFYSAVVDVSIWILLVIIFGRCKNRMNSDRKNSTKSSMKQSLLTPKNSESLRKNKTFDLFAQHTKIYHYPWFFDWPRKFLPISKTGESEIVSGIHYDASLYIRFLVLLLVASFYFSIMGLALLFIDLTGEKKTEIMSILLHASIINIHNDSWRLIVIFIVICLMSVTLYALCWFYRKDIIFTLYQNKKIFRKSKKKTKSNPNPNPNPNQSVAGIAITLYGSDLQFSNEDEIDNATKDGRLTLIHIYGLPISLRDENLLQKAFEHIVITSSHKPTSWFSKLWKSNSTQSKSSSSSHHENLAYSTHLPLSTTSHLSEYDNYSPQIKNIVPFIHIVPDLTLLSKLVTQKEYFSNLLDRVTLYEQNNMVSPSIFQMMSFRERCIAACDSVLYGHNAREYYEDRIKRYSSLIANEDQRKHKTTGHAFIAFERYQYAKVCLAVKTLQLGSYGTCRIKSKIAPNFSLINWTSMSMKNPKLRWFLGNLFLTFVSLMVLIPCTVMNQIDPLLGYITSTPLIQKHSMTVAFFTKFFPAGIIYSLNSLFFPHLIETTTDFEAHPFHNQKLRSNFPKQTFFLFLNTVILPTIILSSLAEYIIIAFYKGESMINYTWHQMLGNILLHGDHIAFFFVYLTHSTFLGSAFSFHNVGEWISKKYRLRNAITEKEISDATQVSVYDYGYYYGLRIVMFSLVFSFGIISPLILPLGFIYIAFSLWVDYTKITNNIYKIDINSQGSFSRSVIGYILLLTAFFQFCIGSIFWSTGGIYSQIFSFSCWIMTVFTMVLWFVSGFDCFYRGIDPVNTNWIQDYTTLAFYVHPLAKIETIRDHTFIPPEDEMAEINRLMKPDVLRNLQDTVTNIRNTVSRRISHVSSTRYTTSSLLSG